MYSATVVSHYTCTLTTSIFSYMCVSSDLESIVQEESLEENNEQIELSLMAEEDDNKLDEKYTPVHEVSALLVQYSTVQCSTVQCSAVQCSAVQCSTVQYSTSDVITTIPENRYMWTRHNIW
jgi:hypothetical protein